MIVEQFAISEILWSGEVLNDGNRQPCLTTGRVDAPFRHFTQLLNPLWPLAPLLQARSPRLCQLVREVIHGNILPPGRIRIDPALEVCRLQPRELQEQIAQVTLQINNNAGYA